MITNFDELNTLYSKITKKLKKKFNLFYDELLLEFEELLISDLYTDDLLYKFMADVKKDLDSFAKEEKKLLKSKLADDGVHYSSFLKSTYGLDPIDNDFINTKWAPDGKTFTERIDANTISLIYALEKTLLNNVASKQNVTNLLRTIDIIFNANYKKAVRLFTTESAYIDGAIALNTYIHNNIKQYVYHTAGDEKVCEDCAILDGNTFNVADAKIGVNFPNLHVNCRCYTVPVV